ncbi:MAG TPA: hypothetical protein VG253_25055 [Streptosporangiaceae bacterium]|nr:hypothetical protein [Streptosporangiaceae bacterium]
MHGTILHSSMYRFDDQTAAFGLPAEDDGSRDDALWWLNMPSCPARRHDFDALRPASARIVVGVEAQSATMIVGRAGVALAERLGTAPVTFLGGEYGGMGEPRRRRNASYGPHRLMASSR